MGSRGGRTKTRISRRGRAAPGGNHHEGQSSSEARGSSRDSACTAEAAVRNCPFTGKAGPRLQPRNPMTPFRYRAARADGGIVEGIVDAASAWQANAVVTDRGLFPLAVTPAEAADGARRPASRRDLAIVFQSIAALVSAGVPLERAVASSEALARGPLRDTLATARLRLREGEGFGAALGAARGVMPGIVLGMLRTGERGSQLPFALAQVATHLEQEADLVARVRQALAYPLLLAVVGVASIVMIGRASCR